MSHFTPIKGEKVNYTTIQEQEEGQIATAMGPLLTTPESKGRRWTDTGAPNTAPVSRSINRVGMYRTMRRRDMSMPVLSSVHLQSMLREEPYVQGLASSFETGANIVKAVMGAAMFAIPHVFMKMGIFGGSLVTVVLASLTAYSMLLLLEAKHLVASETMQQYIRYVDIARHAFGAPGATLLFVLSVFASLGVAAANLTFVGATIVDILHFDYNVPAPGHTTNADADWSNSAWMFTVGALVIITPLTWLRSFKILAYAAILGNVCLLAGVIGVIGFGYSEVHQLHQVDAINFAELPKSMGTISFVFCINFLLLPIERSMHRHAPFKKILYMSFGGVTAWILAFGILAYALFEEETCINVLYNLNLQAKGAKMGGAALKLALCIAQITSYPLVMAPACETFEILMLSSETNHREAKRRAIRFTLILVTVGMAQIRSFGLITNLLGGLTSLPLSLVLPPAIFIKLARDAKRKAHAKQHSGSDGSGGSGGSASSKLSSADAAPARSSTDGPQFEYHLEDNRANGSLKKGSSASLPKRTRLQMRSTPSSAFVTPKARYPNQYEDDLDSDGLLDDSRCMDGDSSSDDEEIGSPSVSAEDVGLVPSTWEVSGAWAVLICGTIITLVTIAYTVLEIVNPAGAGQDCSSLAPNASNHSNHNHSDHSNVFGDGMFGPIEKSEM